MQNRYIAPVVMLIAGAITSILNIVNDVEFLFGLKRLLAVLIIFYIIGKVAAKIIIKVTSPNKADMEAETEESKEVKEDKKSVEQTAETKDQ